MITLKVLPIAQLLLILFFDLVLSYPSSFYNAKRFSRSSHRPSYDPYDYYSRSQRYPYAYYPSYAQVYPDEYYYNQDVYPFYYVSPRPSKYALYQATLPYYYQDLPLARNKYNNYYSDLNIDDQERLLQEIEREQRERAQPIGHEIRYENDYNTAAAADDDDNDESVVDETNAAFLNNLMMQQMYQDKLPQPNFYDQYPYTDYTTLDDTDPINIPKWDDVPYDRPVNVEDEDVKELKELPKKQKQRKNRQRKQRKQKNVISENVSKRSEDNAMVYTERKSLGKADPSAEATEGPALGQKEEVLIRPAVPVIRPFTGTALDLLNMYDGGRGRKRSPSVYDTIRHMLDMEKKYEEKQPESQSEVRPSMKKRIVSSEDSLTRQLTVLKKAQ